MKHDEMTDLLGAYALDAVDGAERDAVEAHLAECARCRAEVQEHREVAAMLAHGGGEAPDGVWQRIAGSLEETPPRLRLVPVGRDANGARRSIVTRAVVSALAAAAVVVAVLTVQVRQQDRRIDDLQTALRDPLVPAFQSALEDPHSQVIELTSADGAIVLRGAVTDDGIGYLRAKDLPRLAAGRTYQLWGAAGDQLLSLGVLGAEPGIVTFRADAYEGFAITEEAAPGVVTSRNQPVVAGGAV